MADLQEAGLKLVAEGAEAFESTISGVGDVLSAFGGIALEAASMAAEALGAFFADSFAGALEAEQTIARLGQVIESTGGIAGITVKDAEALADEFKNLAGGSDDAVLSIIDMGLRMGTVSEDMMPSFIQSTLDLGAVMGDAGRASQIMARAIEDPVGVLGTLRKAGILVTEETEAQMKAMIAAGDTAGAYALLMGTVSAATEGAAEVLANTTAGQWAIFKETIADAGETIVGAFLPALMGIAGPILENVVPAIGEFATSVGNIITLITTGDFSGGIFGWMEDDERIDALFEIRDTLIEVGGQITTFATGLVSDFQEGTSAFQPLIDATMNLASAFGESMPMIQGTVQVMTDFVIDQFNTLSPTLIANVSSTLDSIATFWREHGDEIMAVITIAFEFITVTVGVALTYLSGLVAAWGQLVNGDVSGAMETMRDTFSTIMDSILSIVGMDLDSFTESWQGTFTLLGDIVSIGFDMVVSGVSMGMLAAIDTAMGIAASFSTIGDAMIDGIVSAIQSGAADVINSMLGVLQSAIDAAQSLLGIHSPSRVAIEEIGEPISAGIAEGIEDGAVIIDRAFDGLVKNFTATLPEFDDVMYKNKKSKRPSVTRKPIVDKWDIFTDRIVDAIQEGFALAHRISPPAPPGYHSMGVQDQSVSDVRNYHLNVNTPKPMTTVVGEFAVMQTLYGGQI